MSIETTKPSKAPEIILGLAFSEAIDVWSLGTMMASMLLRFDLFPNQSEFETLKIMVKYFGKLPDEILSEGLKTDSFFKKHGQSWKLMTDQEFVKKFHLAPGDIQVYRSEMFSTFEELIRNNSQASCCQEMQKLQDCLALMYQMLQMKEAERITAAQIIDHPALSERSFTVHTM
ncbi:uncharacterized protein [Eucyclogobius newberryi]|uniref:uncharacterized protein n=1 Tax=Eucyclogobius newberryi TaxID=166745 RepID=UPI003B59564E